MCENKKIATAENINIYRQLQKLDHINIIKILSCEEADGKLIVNEEPLEGQSIKEICQNREIDKGTFYDWLLQLCDALECLYGIKPPIANVSLLPESIIVNEDNVIKLTDFSKALNTSQKDKSLAKDLAGITLIMKSVNGKFMKVYDPLIQELESENEIHSIKELRMKINDAHKKKIGIHAFLISAIGIILLIARVLSKLKFFTRWG